LSYGWLYTLKKYQNGVYFITLWHAVDILGFPFPLIPFMTHSLIHYSIVLILLAITTTNLPRKLVKMTLDDEEVPVSNGRETRGKREKVAGA
jgi:hypothetical protein